jgi:hypothetical protein
LARLQVSHPQIFSESHLNCFGIFSSWLSESVQQENKFIVMDDVISSFDANHRKRFADLLVEKFSDYQIILLTHEKQWFDYVKSIIQNKNWLISEIKWSDAKGAYLDESSASLRQRIEHKITNNIEEIWAIIYGSSENVENIAYNLKVNWNFSLMKLIKYGYELLSR